MMWVKSWQTPARRAKASARGVCTVVAFGVEGEVRPDALHQVEGAAKGAAARGKARPGIIRHLRHQRHPQARKLEVNRPVRTEAAPVHRLVAHLLPGGPDSGAGSGSRSTRTRDRASTRSSVWGASIVTAVASRPK